MMIENKYETNLRKIYN